MRVQMPYKEPPTWQLTQPSERERFNGAPPLVVVLTGGTATDIKEAFAAFLETVGWADQ